MRCFKSDKVKSCSLLWILSCKMGHSIETTICSTLKSEGLPWSMRFFTTRNCLVCDMWPHCNDCIVCVLFPFVLLDWNLDLQVHQLGVRRTTLFNGSIASRKKTFMQQLERLCAKRAVNIKVFLEDSFMTWKFHSCARLEHSVKLLSFLHIRFAKYLCPTSGIDRPFLGILHGCH